jgi:ABC-type maltose transport system permease subunit
MRKQQGLESRIDSVMGTIHKTENSLNFGLRVIPRKVEYLRNVFESLNDSHFNTLIISLIISVGFIFVELHVSAQCGHHQVRCKFEAIARALRCYFSFSRFVQNNNNVKLLVTIYAEMF